MKYFLVILGLIIIVVSTLFFMWFSAMGCMSTTGAACHRNDFVTMEAVYMLYLPVLVGVVSIIGGIRLGRKNS